MKRKVHGRRALLNLPGEESTAAIVAEVEDTSTWKKGTDYYGERLKHGCDIEPKVTLRIANCDRSIVFVCPMETKQKRANALHKVSTMIDALTEFRNGLEVEHTRYNGRHTELKKKKK